MKKILLLSWLPVVLLTGCAGLRPPVEAPAGGSVPPAQTPAAAKAPELPREELSPPLLFDLLLGEVAGQRRQLGVSVQHYLRAARNSRDPRVAERALRIALYGKDREAALAAARRWVELDPDRVEAQQSLALLAMAAGKREEALEALDRMVDLLGSDERAFQTVAGMLARERDRKAALALMAALVARHPDSPMAHLAHARLALVAGDAALALDEAGQALALRPGWNQAVIQHALAQLRLGRGDEASRELAAAVEANPRDPVLRKAYARVLLEQKELPASRRQFEALLELEPENADALYSLGLFALEQKELGKGEGYFRKLLELGHHVQEARYYLGRIEESRGKVDQAMAWYRQVTQGEYLLDARLREARLLAGSGRLAEARAMLQRLRQNHPRFASRLYLLEGRLLTEAGRLDEAMALYTQALELNPDNVEVRYARSLLAERLDDLALAEQDLRTILEKEPDNARALNALGYTLADRTDRLEEALALIEKAYKLAPDEPAIVDSLGWVHYRLGHLDEAEKWLRKAWEMARDPEIGAHLGEVLWVQGRKDEARAVWKEAEARQADNRVLRATLQRFLKQE